MAKSGSMIGLIVGVAAAVAVLCTAPCDAADTLIISTMTRTYVPADSNNRIAETTTLVVCTDSDPLLESEDDYIRLVVKSAPLEETSFDGTLMAPSESNCAQFSEEGDLKLPSSPDATYKLTVSNSTGTELKSGSVTFGYPITGAQKISCGSEAFTRLTLTDTTDVPSNCFPGSTVDLCYVVLENNAACLSGLDEINENFQVCTTNVEDSTEVTAPVSFTAQYLEYTAAGANVAITAQGSTGSTLSELLSRVQGDTTLSVHSCSNDVCAINSFTPSKSNYELCGVFTVTDAVSDVGTTTFQDLDLTIDSTDPTVDFHFYNVKKDEPYKVYEDPDLTAFSGKESFSLDCHFISEDSFCNGFLIPDNQQNTPAKIGVAFNDASNAVFTTVDYSRLPGPGSRLRRDPPVGTE